MAMKLEDYEGKFRSRWPKGRWLRGKELVVKLNELKSAVEELRGSALCREELVREDADQLNVLSKQVDDLAFKLKLFADGVSEGGGGWIA
jgi:hypothetical protein